MAFVAVVVAGPVRERGAGEGDLFLRTAVWLPAACCWCWRKLIFKPYGERRQRAIVKQEPRLSRTRNIATIGCRRNGWGVVGCGERSHFCASEFPTNRNDKMRGVVGGRQKRRGVLHNTNNRSGGCSEGPERMCARRWTNCVGIVRGGNWVNSRAGAEGRGAHGALRSLFLPVSACRKLGKDFGNIERSLVQGRGLLRKKLQE